MGKFCLALVAAVMVSCFGFMQSSTAAPGASVAKAAKAAPTVNRDLRQGNVLKVQRWARRRGWRRGGRGYRRWRNRPNYGAIVGGIALGAIIAGAARSAYRPRYDDDEDLCWYWTDRYRTHGYYDYCY